MDQSYFREQAERCRRLAHDGSDPVLQVSLRRLGDDYQRKADELENDEILAKCADPKRLATDASVGQWEDFNENRFDHYRGRAYRNICGTGSLSARKGRCATRPGRYGLHLSFQEHWGMRCEQFAQWLPGGAVPKLLQTTLLRCCRNYGQLF